MKTNWLFFIFLSLLAALNAGSVRKAEDPIRDTQTNPILYEQKKEEEKDGKKGPLMYHVRNNPREAFFIDPPFEKEKEGSARKAAASDAPASAETADWWTEPAADSQALPSAEAVPEPLPEPFPEAEKLQDLEASGEAAPAAEVGGAASGKGDDYWW
jgi:hypothetical protein